MCSSPKPKTSRAKRVVQGTLMGDLTPEEKHWFVVRANIAADRRAAIEKKKKPEHLLSPQKKEGFCHRPWLMMSH